LKIIGKRIADVAILFFMGIDNDEGSLMAEIVGKVSNSVDWSIYLDYGQINGYYGQIKYYKGQIIIGVGQIFKSIFASGLSNYQVE
jgi:hypothetical protein